MNINPAAKYVCDLDGKVLGVLCTTGPEYYTYDAFDPVHGRAAFRRLRSPTSRPMGEHADIDDGPRWRQRAPHSGQRDLERSGNQRH